MAARRGTTAQRPPPPQQQRDRIGTYAKYKRATSYFLDWLLLARKSGLASDVAVSVDQDGRNPLDTYERIVSAIARSPTALPPSLLKRWPLAIAACESAITLRERVAVFYEPSPSYTQHEHFIARLRRWLTTLQDANQPETHDAARIVTPGTARPMDFSNYFDVLDLPEDYFPVETPDATQPTVAASISDMPEEDVPTSEEFDMDFNLEMAYFFMELDELSEAIYSAFFDVKLGTKSLVEAGAVAKVAIDAACSAIARLQLRHPSIRDIDDIYTYVLSTLFFEEWTPLSKTVVDAWRESAHEASSTQTPIYRYKAGSILVDTCWISRVLRSFIPGLKGRENERIQVEPADLGAPYDEDRTPHYAVPIIEAVPEFWKQQIPVLLNLCLEERKRGGSVADVGSIASCFLAPIDRFYRTHVASIETLFVCICWIRSVAALQGNGDLRKNVSLSILHRWDLEDRLRGVGERIRERDKDDPAVQVVDDLMKRFQTGEAVAWALRANPLLASLVLVDYQLEYLRVGTEAMFNSSRLRAFGHVYAAFRHHKLVKASPVWDDLVRIHGAAMFPQCPPTGESVSFLETYIQNSDGVVQAFAQRLRASEEPLSVRPIKLSRDHSQLIDISRVYRLLKTKDFSVLPSELVKWCSWKTLLKAVAGLCSEELFGSRVLSRDLLQFNTDLEGVFWTLRDVLDCKVDMEKLLRRQGARVTRHTTNCALESVVAVRLLSELDEASDDALAEFAAAAAAKDPTLHSCGCAHACFLHTISTLSQIFRSDSDPAKEKQAFCIFPATPNWVRLEFGEINVFREDETNATEEDSFRRVFTTIATRRGVLTKDELQDIKRAVIAHPGILKMQTTDPTMARHPTILHQAVLGRLRDRRLVEWLVQMGALEYQPCSDNGSCGVELAVHSAARAGLLDMVRLLLEGRSLRDIDAVTPVTRESLAHIAVSNGDYALFDTLYVLGAVITGKDAAGKYISDCTEIKLWKQKLLELILARRQFENEDFGPTKVSVMERMLLQLQNEDGDAKQHEAKSLTPQEQRRVAQERLYNNLAARDAVLEALMDPRESNAASDALMAYLEGTLTAKSDDGRQSRNASHQRAAGKDRPVNSNAHTGSTTAQASESEGPPVALAENRIEQLSRALDTLKQNRPKLEDTEREASILSALAILESIKSRLEHFLSSTRKLIVSKAVVVREATDASSALFLLNKFHRQLPPPPRAPRRTYWAEKADEQKLSNWEKLRNWSGSSRRLVHFMNFAACTAQLFIAYGRIPQAREVLELAERRLLQCKYRTLRFREFVKVVSDLRELAGLTPVVGSTPDAARQFEWYLYKHHVEMTGVELLDRMYGYDWYCVLKSVQDLDVASRSGHISKALNTLPPEMSAVVVESTIFLAAETSEQISGAIALLVSVANRNGFRFKKNPVQAKSFELLGFEFSATQIVRVQAAAA